MSPQAVSRWENDAAYPDITLLPGLALFYHTTLDELIGMDDLCKNQRLSDIHAEVLRLVEDGRFDEAIALLKEGLKLLPNQSGLLLALASTLTQKSNQTHDAALAEEAIALSERALQGDLSMKAKSTATVNLIFLYLKLHKTEEAAALVQSLPHLWESRELLLPELYDGESYARELRSAALKTLVLLAEKIRGLPSRQYGEIPQYIQTGVQFETQESAAELLAVIGTFLNA